MCDTWIAMSDATETRNIILGKNSDRPIFDCQPLVLYPRQEWPRNNSLRLEYVELPQAQVTFATLGSSPYWCWGYEEGINEYSLVIGNEAIFTKTFREAARSRQQSPDLGLLGMDLIRLALERCQNASRWTDAFQTALAGTGISLRWARASNGLRRSSPPVPSFTVPSSWRLPST